MRTCDPKRGLQILDAAAQLFANHRYHEVRMDDIAAHAGVAKGTLYRYYHDKEELYLALTIHGIQKLYDQVHDQVIRAGDPDQKLRDFVTSIVRYYEQYPYYLELIQRIESSGSSASVKALDDIRTQWYHLVTDLVKQLTGAKEPLTSETELAARALQGMIRGVLRFTPQPWPSDLADRIYHQIMHGLAGAKMHVAAE
jgi:TetR/AcrR family fatty acid metabolism transcriptional regulator